MISIIQPWKLRLRQCALQRSVSEQSLKCLWPGPHLLDKALGPYLGFLGQLDQTHVSCLIHHQALPPILVLAMHNVLFFKILLKF